MNLRRFAFFCFFLMLLIGAESATAQLQQNNTRKDDNLLFMPTAFVQPKGTINVTLREIMFLNVDYSITSKLQVGGWAILAPGAFLETLSACGKYNYYQSGNFFSTATLFYSNAQNYLMLGNVISRDFRFLSLHAGLFYSRMDDFDFYTPEKYDKDHSIEYFCGTTGLELKATKRISLITEYGNYPALESLIYGLKYKAKKTHWSLGLWQFTAIDEMLFYLQWSIFFG